MKIFKFGGASVSSVERIENVKSILQSCLNEKILVVISAMGKTTNALEKVVEAFFIGNKKEALQLFDEIKENHLQIANALAPQPVAQLNDLFTEVEWLLHDRPVKEYNYYYDQIVCLGELLSTAIISNYLTDAGVDNKWIDVRDIIRTDDNFRDARIDWNFTNARVQNAVAPLFNDYNIIITQGFIGATDENESTTLGREGSDFTAAVFANLLNAESVTIWKDVQGVMNADPKLYPQAQWIKELNYNEVIEMAYYGAQIIHPKTIKPLQNKNIPLFVKSFLHPAEEGTFIHNTNITGLPSIIVFKQAQVLMHLTSKDFSFVSEGLTGEVNKIFSEIKFKPNLTQLAAISMMSVVDDNPQKIDLFAQLASQYFNVQIQKGLTLITVRHYQNDLLQQLVGNNKILLKQQTPDTVQLLLATQ